MRLIVLPGMGMEMEVGVGVGKGERMEMGKGNGEGKGKGKGVDMERRKLWGKENEGSAYPPKSVCLHLPVV